MRYICRECKKEFRPRATEFICPTCMHVTGYEEEPSLLDAVVEVAEIAVVANIVSGIFSDSGSSNSDSGGGFGSDDSFSGGGGMSGGGGASGDW